MPVDKSLPIFTPELVRTYYAPRSDLADKLPPHAYEVNRPLAWSMLRGAVRPCRLLICGFAVRLRVLPRSFWLLVAHSSHTALPTAHGRSLLRMV